IPHVAIGLALLSRAARAEELLLARLAAKRSSADRRILLYALGLVGSARAAPAVLEALEDASSPAAGRAYAAGAAGELLDRAPRSDLARLRWAFDAAAEPDLVKLRGLFGTP